MSFKTINDFDFTGKTVLLRADLNVPVQDGKVTDTTRIDRVRPTIEALLDKGAKIIVLSHFGRPKGKVVPEMSLAFLAPVLTGQWDVDVAFAESGEAVGDSKVTLLENLRFNPGEEANDPAFIKDLAALGDIYINDAFSASHRAHASTEGLAHALPAGAGLLMQAELEALNAALENPQRPVAAIVGGAKISTKLELLGNLVTKVDYLILGGGMANTFSFAKGIDVGKSLCEKDMADQAREIMGIAEKHGCEIVLPADRVLIREFKENAPYDIGGAGDIPADQEAVDIGPATVEKLGGLLKDCKTVLWNGPMGVFEMKPFDYGTNGLAKIVADLTAQGQLVSVAGGGDTVAALEQAGVADQFTYISTAGGAFLEWLEGKVLPGVAALEKFQNAA